MPKLTMSRLSKDITPFTRDQKVYQIDLDKTDRVIVSGKKGKSGLFVKMSVPISALKRHECIEMTDEEYGEIVNANVVEKEKRDELKVRKKERHSGGDGEILRPEGK